MDDESNAPGPRSPKSKNLRPEIACVPDARTDEKRRTDDNCFSQERQGVSRGVTKNRQDPHDGERCRSCRF